MGLVLWWNMAKKPRKSSVALRPRLRVLCKGETALGPGRVDLFELIEETGSLRSAARRMGMSYMRAWKLVKSSNARFRPDLVEVSRGGKSGGGARLTRSGKEAVALYRRMEAQTKQAVQESWMKLRKLLTQ